jgi:cold shock protein
MSAHSPATQLGVQGLIEISGVIKWFDVRRGFGFVIPDNADMPEAHLDTKNLENGGFAAPAEGMRIVCRVRKKPRGLKVAWIVSLNGVDAITVAREPPPPSVVPTSAPVVATCRWWNSAKHYGFLTEGEGTPDIFVHTDTLQRFGMARLRLGQAVLVRYGEGPRGRTAIEIHPYTPQ